MRIEPLYENAQLIAVAKPSGQLVIPGRGEIGREPLVTELEKQLGQKVFVVHRLDLGASGVVLFAKTAEAHRYLSMQFEKRLVRKTYDVVVQGQITAPGTIDQPLHAFGSGRMGIHLKGKASQTEYKVIQSLKDATHVGVNPLTGRRHQIRVHLYSIGHPVMGDELYGKDRPVGGIPRLMLHARTLEFQTMDETPCTLTAPLPEDFQTILSSLR